MKNKTPRVTYREINEGSKRMFLEYMQRKWIDRNRSMGEARPSTTVFKRRRDQERQRIIDLQRNYWQRIGMLDNFKMAKANFEKANIKDLHNKRIGT
jgi:hypothetical protein